MKKLRALWDLNPPSPRLFNPSFRLSNFGYKAHYYKLSIIAFLSKRSLPLSLSPFFTCGYLPLILRNHEGVTPNILAASSVVINSVSSDRIIFTISSAMALIVLLSNVTFIFDFFDG